MYLKIIQHFALFLLCVALFIKASIAIVAELSEIVMKSLGIEKIPTQVLLLDENHFEQSLNAKFSNSGLIRLQQWSD